MKVFRTGLLDHAPASDVGYADVPLAELHSTATLAALGGLLVAPIIPIGPDVGFSLLLASFAAVVIGGFDRINAAVAAAFGVALAQQYLSGYLSPNYVEAYPFIILLVMLIIKPHGVVRGLAGVRY